MAAAAAQYIAASSAVKPEGRRGRGENGKPFSKDFNQSNCIFCRDDNSLVGCVSMFKLFCVHCPALGELRKLFCSGDGTAQFVGSPA